MGLPFKYGWLDGSDGSCPTSLPAYRLWCPLLSFCPFTTYPPPFHKLLSRAQFLDLPIFSKLYLPPVLSWVPNLRPSTFRHLFLDLPSTSLKHRNTEKHRGFHQDVGFYELHRYLIGMLHMSRHQYIPPSPLYIYLRYISAIDRTAFE